MSVSEADRNMVYQAFADRLTQPVAEIVMELLFTQPTGELVTQADLHANTSLLRGEIAELRAELRGEMAELRAELRGEIAELRGEIAELRGEMTNLRGELKADIGNLYRWGAGVMVANGIAVVTALIT